MEKESGERLKAGKRKILVIDDEPDMRIFLSSLMKANGYNPVAAANVQEGLEKTKNEKPDCIILNVMMAEAEGLGLYFHIKHDELLKNIPIVMLSNMPKKAFFHYGNLQKHKRDWDGFEPEIYLETPPEALEVVNSVKKIFNQQEMSHRLDKP